MTPLLDLTTAALSIAGFSAVLFVVTWFFGRHFGNKTIEGFTVVERKVPWWIGGPSIAAAWTWAVALMISVQMAYQDGLAGIFWFTVPNVIAVLVYIWLGPQIRDVFPEGHSLPEWIHEKFNHRGVTGIYLLGIVIGSGLAIVAGVPLIAYASVWDKDSLLATTYVGIVCTSALSCWFTRTSVVNG